MGKRYETCIRHGDLVLEFRGRECVCVARQSDGSAVCLTLSEWAFLLACADLREWPIVSPLEYSEAVRKAKEEAEDLIAGS